MKEINIVMIFFSTGRELSNTLENWGKLTMEKEKDKNSNLKKK